MRLRWLSLLSLFFAATCTASKSAQTLCEPGTEIFCRCRGGDPGTKLCNDAGDGFSECRLADGECTEIPDPTTDQATSTTSTGVGGAGGAAACIHDLCEPGAALELGCDPCTTDLCTSVDPFCCDKLQSQKGQWDEMCISEAKNICGLQCADPTTTSTSSGGSTTSSSSGGPMCIDIQLMIPGDLVVTEFMNDSSSLPDTQGEWIEIYNTQKDCIELQGLTIESANDPKPHVIGASVIVPPKGYAVLCKDKATLAGIGVACDYSVGSSINLGNTTDTINLKAASLLVDGVAYTSTVIHPVGAARQLDPMKVSHKLNDDEHNWCAATSFINGMSGDRGTPGKANTACVP